MAKEFKFPDVGEGIHEGVIVKWRVKEGDAVNADQIIVEVETDKAVVEIPTPFAGNVLKINFKEGDTIKVGQTLVVIGEPGEKVDSVEAVKAQLVAPVPVEKKSDDHVLATPAVRKLARELGVDLAEVHGSGPAGRITEEDVRNAPSGVPQKEPKKDAPVVTEDGDMIIELTHMRKVIAEKMSYSKTNIPHACGMDFVDVTKLSAIREKEKDDMTARGVKLTYLPFIVKACAIALHKFPEFNAHFDGKIILKKQLAIGIAVETQDGLMAPVLRNIEKKSVVEIAQEIEYLAKMARERKIKLEDLKGSTFTITNIGSIGGFFSTPIINPPEVAILGVNRIREMAWVVDGKVKPRKILGLSLCFDHRVNDGAKAAEFVNEIKMHLEDPNLMLVDMI